MDIREAQIEDILVNAPMLTQQILRLPEEPRLIARQMILPSGRLDMLYAHQRQFLLLELKIEPFQQRFVEQVLSYYQDLQQIQDAGRLFAGVIRPYLVCPSFTEKDLFTAANAGITCVQYDPEAVLRYFYEHLRPVASFSEIKPIDIGIWNLHLIHKFIYFLEETSSVKALQHLVGGSPKTLYNKVRFAHELQLIQWEAHSDMISLTAIGKEYVAARDNAFDERLSEEQASILRKIIVQNPYASSVILGIASIAESVFAMSKNVHPVPLEQLSEYFTYHSGKVFDWQTPKAKYNATRMYANYAVDLGLLAKTDTSVYVTPEGYKFTAQMQLHKSLRLVDTLVVR